MGLTRVVILKRGMLESNGWTPMGGRPAAATSALGVETAHVSAADMQNLQRDLSVKAWAKDLPLRLIDPIPLAVPTAASGNGGSAPPEGVRGEPVPTWGLAAIGAARDGPRSGRGVRIAVLDTGIDRNHPAFAGIELDPNRNLHNFTKERGEDLNGHGTHCAATIFGRDVDGHRIGVARGVTDVLIGKVLGANGGGYVDIADALQWAFGQGAHIVSMSLGIDFNKHLESLREELPPPEATAQALTDYGACVRVFDSLCGQLADVNGIYRGMLIVAAAGNESKRPDYAVTVAPPANAFRVVSVGAVGHAFPDAASLGVAPFSNRLPTLCAPGLDVVSAGLNGGLTSLNGTSMAAPHVAGVAALYAEEQIAAAPGQFRPELVVRAMLERAKKLPIHKPEDVGAGLVQAP